MRPPATPVRLLLATGLALAVVGCGDDAGTAAGSAEPAPSCFPTPATAEGPNRPATPPDIGQLAGPDTAGIPLTVGGRILDASTCTPLPAADIEAWQTDADGSPDPADWLTGRVLAGGDGFELRTVYPGGTEVDGTRRPPEVHLVVTAPGYEPLVTTVRFAGEDNGDHDPLLVLSVAGDEQGRAVPLDLVLTPTDG